MQPPGLRKGQIGVPNLETVGARPRQPITMAMEQLICLSNVKMVGGTLDGIAVAPVLTFITVRIPTMYT